MWKPNQENPLQCHFGRLQSDNEAAIHLTHKQKTEKRLFLDKLNTGQYSVEETPSLCGVLPHSDESLLLACKDRFGLPVKTWLSKRSGLLWSSPVLTQESLREYYAKDYRALYNQDESTETLFLFQLKRGVEFIEWLRRKSEFFANPKEVRIAEIGCGSGGILKAFDMIGCHCTGCDFDEACINYGQSQNLDLRIGDEKSLDEANYDLIICSHLLEHLRRPDLFLTSLKSLLKDDGMCFCAIPGVLQFHRSETNFDFQKYLQNAHLHHFSKETLSAVATRCGFEVVAADERVWMLLRKSDAVEPIPWRSEHFHEIMNYLETCERMIQYPDALYPVKVEGRYSRIRLLNRVLDNQNLRLVRFRDSQREELAKLLAKFIL